MLPRRFFSSTRRRRAALVGLVARRGTGRTAAARISAIRRSSASARLRSWVRWLCAVITSTPSRVRRRPASRSSRARTSSVSEGERRTSKRSCTAVESLLTFCPPGPEARMKLSTSSLLSSAMWSVMRIMIRWCDVSRETRFCRAPPGRNTAKNRHRAPCPMKFLTPPIRAGSLSGPVRRRRLRGHHWYRLVILGGIHETQAYHCRNAPRRDASARSAGAAAAGPAAGAAARAATAAGAEADRGAAAEGRERHRRQQGQDGFLLQADEDPAADGNARREEGRQEDAGAGPAGRRRGAEARTRLREDDGRARAGRRELGRGQEVRRDPRQPRHQVSEVAHA